MGQERELLRPICLMTSLTRFNQCVRLNVTVEMVPGILKGLTMDIQFMEVPSTDINAEGKDLTIMVDNETVIRVRNYGSGLYEWRVDPNHSDYDPMATMIQALGSLQLGANDSGWFTAAQSFGQLATWWDARTFAHAIMDVINNY